VFNFRRKVAVFVNCCVEIGIDYFDFLEWNDEIYKKGLKSWREKKKTCKYQ